MGSDRLKKMFEAAASNGIVIPAFNVYYLPIVQAIAAALREHDTFGLIEVSRIEFQKFVAKNPTAVAEEYQKRETSGLMALHLDHIPVIDEDGMRVDWQTLISEGIAAGYDSVMIDGSRLPFEENVEITSQVVRMAHAEGVLVEAELGAVLGHESEILPPYEELFASKRGFTDPDQAREFVSRTGVDWLSVSVGSIHGPISGAAMDCKKVAARLDIEHLSKLRSAAGVPLVLHGGSGVQQSYVDKAIQNGLVKVNIGTDIRQAYDRVIAEGGSVADAQASVTERVGGIVRDQYRIEESAARLSSFLGDSL